MRLHRIFPAAAEPFCAARCRETNGFYLPRKNFSASISKLPLRPAFAAAGCAMKRSRRVILTMMGTGAVGAVSMGFVRRDCGPGRVAVVAYTPDGRPVEVCRSTYGGF